MTANRPMREDLYHGADVRVIVEPSVASGLKGAASVSYQKGLQSAFMVVGCVLGASGPSRAVPWVIYQEDAPVRLASPRARRLHTLLNSERSRTEGQRVEWGGRAPPAPKPVAVVAPGPLKQD
jgi:hypothetical protein